MNFLDKLPPAARHAVFAAASILALAGITYAQAHYTEWNLSAPLEGIIAVLIPILIAYCTPLTAQYGVGSSVLPTPTQDGPQDVVPPAGV